MLPLYKFTALMGQRKLGKRIQDKLLNNLTNIAGGKVNNLKHYVLYTITALLWAFIILFVVFSEPAFGYANNKEFIESVNKCADYLEKNIKKEDRIPRKLLLAQAALESNYGRSRYAREGNNLMGIYQFKNLHTGMAPRDNPNATFRVARFQSKCHSIKYYMNLLNTKDSYVSFRNERLLQSKLRTNDVNRYFHLLYNYSTNPEYPQLLIRTHKEIKDLGF
jgi:flagellum-specific peptidoglycan hydrolase FlgJ